MMSLLYVLMSVICSDVTVMCSKFTNKIKQTPFNLRASWVFGRLDKLLREVNFCYFSQEGGGGLTATVKLLFSLEHVTNLL